MDDSSQAESGERTGPPALGLDRPHPARMYDYYLGGKDHYELDRVAAHEVETTFPGISMCARVNRAFMHRSTRELVRRGYRQWLDIGTGIPTRPNLHEVAQEAAAETRVVYVDNDPLVLTHARALLTSTPEGRTAYVQADVTSPEQILGSPELRTTLDLSQPVVLSLHALLHFVPDSADPHGIVRRLLAALPSGSALSLTHCTGDFAPATWQKIVTIYRLGGIPAQVRHKDEVAGFFDGLRVLEPGIVLAHRWRPNDLDRPVRSPDGRPVGDAEVSLWAGIGIKP